MLSMTAGQIGNPIAIVVLVIPDDRLLHVVMIHLLQEARWYRHTTIGSPPSFPSAILLAQSHVNASRTAVRAAERQKNTSIAFPHFDRSFL